MLVYDFCKLCFPVCVLFIDWCWWVLEPPYVFKVLLRCLLLLQLTIFVVCCFTALLKNPYINSWSLNPIYATPVDSNGPGLLVSITSRRVEDVRVTRVTMSIKHLSSSTSSTSINSFPSLSLGFSLSKFRFHVMMTVWRLEMAHEIILSSSSSNSWC